MMTIPNVYSKVSKPIFEWIATNSKRNWEHSINTLDVTMIYSIWIYGSYMGPKRYDI
jgi:hypothetical protein